MDEIKTTAEIEDHEDAPTGLDAVIAKAIDAPAEVEETPEPDRDVDVNESDPDRDEKGRFKAKDDGAEDDGEPDPEAPAEADGGEPQTPEADADPSEPATPQWTDGHFTGWTPEQRQSFERLPADAQQLIMDRQSSTQAFFQRKMNDGDTYKTQAEPLVQAAQKVNGFAQSIGTTPADLLQRYAAADYALRYSPYEQKVKLFSDLAKQYGIPFAQPEPDPYAEPTNPGGEAYPVIHDLQTQNQQLQAQINALQSNFTTQSQHVVDDQIRAFSDAKDAAGNPKHPYFDMVKGAMAQILTQPGNETLSMEDAYMQAAKPIEDRLAAEVGQRTEVAEQTRQKAVERAKKAAPVKASGASPGGQTKSKNLDSILEENLTAAGFA